MARQSLGKKKVAALRRLTGLPVLYVMVRGGTDHRRDLIMEDGSLIHLYKDGQMETARVGPAIQMTAEEFEKYRFRIAKPADIPETA